MPTTEQTARPDLSSLDLDWDTRANIVLAEAVDGATWDPDGYRYRVPIGVRGIYTREETAVALVAASGRVLVHRSGPGFRIAGLRDYLNDPAAAWSLMERTGVWVEPRYDAQGNITGWAGWYPNGFACGCTQHTYPPDASRRALVVAALHRHADGPFADVIRPLLEEVGHG